nr:Tn3 family transposase [Thermomonospora umbrina]
MLGLVANAVALWNTRYLSAAVDRLRAQRVQVKNEDVARLSPLGHAHVNFLGRCAITASAPIQGYGTSGRSPTFPTERAETGAERHAEA